MKTHLISRIAFAVGLGMLATLTAIPAASAATKSAGADLAISVSTSPAQANTQEPLTYSFVVTNAGPATASSAALTDNLPVPSVGVSPSQGTCVSSSSPDVVRCALGDLASGSTARVDITVQPSTTGTLTNTASVTSPTQDTNGANNSVSVSTNVSLGRPLPASCTPSYDPNRCSTAFTTTVVQQVRLALEPSSAFDGVLRAYVVQRSSYAVVGQVSGTYVAGQLVSGQSSMVVTLPAGDWGLDVTAGEARIGGFTICPNPISGCYYGWPGVTVPWIANVPESIGSFAASVSAA